MTARPRAGPREAALLALLCTAGAALLAAVSLQRFTAARSGTYDLVIFDQAVRSYSRLGEPVAVVKGVHNGFGPDFSVLGDHVSPVLVLLAPLYRVDDSPVTLLVAQAVLLAAGAVPVWVLTRRLLGPVPAAAVAAAYLVSWPVIGAAHFDFHEVAFAPLLVGLLLERLDAWAVRGAPLWHVAAAAAGVAAVKEDMGLLLAGVGAAAAVLALVDRRRPGRRPARHVALFGAGLAAAGLAWTAVCVRVVIPAAGGKDDYYWRYDDLGPGPAQAAWALVADPVGAAQLFVTPEDKARTLVMLAGIGVAAWVLSPYALGALPLLGVRMFSGEPNWWSAGFHYDAAIVAVLVVAAVDAVARLRRWAGSPPLARTATWLWLGATVLSAAAALPGTRAWGLGDAAQWQPPPHLDAALAAVPDGALAEVPNVAGPRLTDRATVLLLDRVPRGAEWVVVDTRTRQFPFCSLEEQRDRVPALLAAGYEVAAEEGPYLVLRDPTPTPDLDSGPSLACSGPTAALREAGGDATGGGSCGNGRSACHARPTPIGRS